MGTEAEAIQSSPRFFLVSNVEYGFMCGKVARQCQYGIIRIDGDAVPILETEEWLSPIS
jgi:hypothetical protein